MTDKSPAEHHHLIRSASVITAITLLSRIFGYVRDQRIAFLLGTGMAADAFTTANRIPNLLRRLVGEGAVSAAFIPVFSKLIAQDRKKEAFELANALLSLATAILVAVTLLGMSLAPQIVSVLAPGFEMTAGKVEKTAFLTRLIFPYLLCVSLSALAMGVLNSLHRFSASAFAPVLLNISIVTASFVASRSSASPETILAIGIVIGGVLQILVQIPHLIESGWRYRFIWDLANPGVRQIAKLMGPVVLGAGIVQVNVLISTNFASSLEQGSVMALYLSDRVMELVLGGYAIAISTVILPLMSRQAAEKRFDELKQTLNFGIRLILFITVPATAGLIVLRRPIIEVLFEHGDFDAASTALTAWPLIFFALGLSAFSLVKVIVPAFYSMQDTTTPVKIAVASLFVNVGMNYLFIRPLANGGPALATTLSSFFDCGVLLVIFRRRYGRLNLGAATISLARSAGAALVLSGAVWAVIQWPGVYAGGLPQRAAALALSIGVGALSYFVVMWLAGSTELKEVRSMVRRQSASPS